MITRVVQRNVSISSRKANLCCRLIRNKPVDLALRILENQPQKASKYLFKLVSSAIANGINNHSMVSKNFYIYESFANQGRSLKRLSIRARGRTDLIKKRSTNLVIAISDDKEERKKLNRYLLKPRAHQYKYKKLSEKQTPIEIKPKLILKKEYERRKKDGSKG